MTEVPMPETTEVTIKILIMDDEYLVRDLLKNMMEHQGYTATTCSNGTDAVSHYKTAHENGSPFAAVIMDLEVPGGMGGREATKRILEFDPRARVIVASGSLFNRTPVDYRKFGFCAALPKPFNTADMVIMLKEVLSLSAQ